MKIGITNDHRGVERKNQIMKFLIRKGYEVVDMGANTSESVDYPTYAFNLCEKVSNKELDFGILLCGTGIGMSIAANKVNGIRCAKVDNTKDAKLARLHNNANAIAFSSSLSMIRTKDILETFLKTPFSNDERHIRRNNLVDSYNRMDIKNDN